MDINSRPFGENIGKKKLSFPGVAHKIGFMLNIKQPSDPQEERAY